MARTNKVKKSFPDSNDGKMEHYLFDADFELTRLITLTSESIYKVRQKELNTYRIHIRRSAIIRAIYILGDNATPTTISRQLSRQRHTIREQLVKMQQEGIVEIIKDLRKKNMIRVILTKKGLTKYHQIQKADSLRDIMSPLTYNEREELTKYLTIIRKRALENLKGKS
jgi:DNA-binding MarR family transcriptional regulator